MMAINKTEMDGGISYVERKQGKRESGMEREREISVCVCTYKAEW